MWWEQKSGIKARTKKCLWSNQYSIHQSKCENVLTYYIKSDCSIIREKALKSWQQNKKKQRWLKVGKIKIEEPVNWRILFKRGNLKPSLYLSAKSQLREVLDDMAAKSKVKLNYELPDEVVEDYTYEMGRLKFKVTKNLDLCKSICFVSSRCLID